jgi:hypothetical protein
MRKPNTLILCVIFYLSLQTRVSYSSQKNITATLYYHMGEQGGWVPFNTGPQTGQQGLFMDVADALQTISQIQFAPVSFPPKRAEKP